jgi:hypothetical protein
MSSIGRISALPNVVANEKRLGIRFQVIVPQQMFAGTGVGDTGANAYARAAGITPQEFLTRFGPPLPPSEFGEKVVSALSDPTFSKAFAIGLKGETGTTVLEEMAS